MITSKRIALGVRYDGYNYRGWQSQIGVITVQDRVERALSQVANHTVQVVCAGRTDAGVHATSQVVHFNTEADRSEYSWKFGANSNLPPDISIVWSKQVEPDFHSRFSATGRRYRYIILNQDARPGIMRHSVSWCHRPLDEAAMHEGAQHLLGENDFSAFRGSDCQANSPMRNMYSLSVERKGRLIIVEVHGNAFLLHMVRNIVGVLIEVGEGRRPPSWVKEVLESRDRRCGGVTTPPNGLYLVGVDYPDKYDIPKVPSGPFFLGLE